MTSREIQDFVHIYSMFLFKGNNRVSGIVVNKYNVATMQVEFYFIDHDHMHAYKKAFDQYDRETCNSLSKRINTEDVLSIRPVSLSEYKIIMQLMGEQRTRINMI